MRSTIYVIKNKINGKCYVGQTTGLPKERFLQHKRLARMGKGYVFHAAIRKYGEANFEIIEEISEDIDKIDKLEANKVIEYNSCIPNGYNILEYGNISGLKEGWWIGKTRSEETKQKISESKKGTQIGESNPFFGKHHSKETIIEANKKRSQWWDNLSKEEKEELINRAKENRINTAISEEVKQKISKANSGKVRTKEMKEHQRQAHLGKTHSEETKEKMSLAKLGKKKSNETRTKMQVAQRAKVSPEAKERVRKIHELSDKGLSNKDIAAEVGCGYEYVRKVRKGQRGLS